MIYIFSIYILGIIAYLLTIWIGYRNLDSGTEITLSDLTFYLIMGVFSWIAFSSAILVMNGDKIVLKKK